MRLNLLVKETRVDAGWSQREAGRRTGFERRAVSQMEAGERPGDLAIYAPKLAMAAQDFQLAKHWVEAMFGAPLAGAPMPSDVDGHPLAIRQLAGRRLQAALAEFDGLDAWKPPTEAQRERVLKALGELWAAASAVSWLIEATARQYHVDPRHVMQRQVVLGLPRRVAIA